MGWMYLASASMGVMCRGIVVGGNVGFGYPVCDGWRTSNGNPLQCTKNHNWLHQWLHSMSVQLIQDVDERIYRAFRDRCGDLNIDLGKAVTDALDMWLEHFDYDGIFIELQRKILREEEFVSLDEI